MCRKMGQGNGPVEFSIELPTSSCVRLKPIRVGNLMQKWIPARFV
jgi:hypothetical protein